MQPVSPPVVTPFCISLTCGQDIAVETLEGVLGLTISCEIYSELDSLTTEVYKDGVLISRCFQLHFKSVSNYHFGTYTFVVSTKFCGSTTVVSRIFHKGQF